MSIEKFIWKTYLQARDSLDAEAFQYFYEFAALGLDKQCEFFEWYLEYLELLIPESLKNSIRETCYVEVLKTIIRDKEKSKAKEFKEIVDWLCKKNLDAKNFCKSFAMILVNLVDVNDFGDLLWTFEYLQELLKVTQEIDQYLEIVLFDIEKFVFNVLDKNFNAIRLFEIRKKIAENGYDCKRIDLGIEKVIKELVKKIITMKEFVMCQRVKSEYKKGTGKELTGMSEEIERVVMGRFKEIVERCTVDSKEIPMVNNTNALVCRENEKVFVYTMKNEIDLYCDMFYDIAVVNEYLEKKGIKFENIMVQIDYEYVRICIHLENGNFDRSYLLETFNELNELIPYLRIQKFDE